MGEQYRCKAIFLGYSADWVALAFDRKLQELGSIASEVWTVSPFDSFPYVLQIGLVVLVLLLQQLLLPVHGGTLRKDDADIPRGVTAISDPLQHITCHFTRLEYLVRRLLPKRKIKSLISGCHFSVNCTRAYRIKIKTIHLDQDIQHTTREGRLIHRKT